MSAFTEKLGRLFGRRKAGASGTLDVHVQANADDLPVRKMSKAQRREATLLQLQQGYQEVAETMKSLRGHMEEQARRSDRMLSLMEGVPDVLRTIPEANERQTQVLVAMQSQMETQARNSEQLSSALVELAGATGRQQDALTNLQQQMEASRQSGENLRDSLGILSETMETMTDASRSNVEAVNAIAEQTRDNQSSTEQLYRKTHRQSVVMASVSWALALVALAVAAYVAVMVSNLSSQQPPDTAADTSGTVNTAGIVGAGDGASTDPAGASAGAVPVTPEPTDPPIDPDPLTAQPPTVSPEPPVVPADPDAPAPPDPAGPAAAPPVEAPEAPLDAVPDAIIDPQPIGGPEDEVAAPVE